jgi:hypothetical protein
MGRDPDLSLAGLSVWALGREFEEAEDYWDGNWLRVHVRVEANGARVEFTGPWLRNDEIRAFAEQLERVHRDLSGTATLDCTEPMLNAKVVCGSRGQIEVTIEATPDYLNQAHRFEFSIDQSYLNQTLAGCRRLLERFPIKGSSTDS